MGYLYELARKVTSEKEGMMDKSFEAYPLMGEELEERIQEAKKLLNLLVDKEEL